MAEPTKAELEKQLEAREAEANALRSELDTRQKENTALTERLQQLEPLEAENAELKAALREQTAKAEEVQGALTQRDEQVTRLTEQLGQLLIDSQTVAPDVPGALIAYLESLGFENAEADASLLLRHWVDFARFSNSLPERIVRAVMALGD